MATGRSPRLPKSGRDGEGDGGGGAPGVMDSSRKATAAGRQRTVARLAACSSSPACSVRAPWGVGGSGAQRGPRSPDKGLPGERLSRPGHSPPRGATHSLKPRGAGGTLTHRRAWGGAGLRPGQGVRALLTTARRFSTWKAATAKALAPEDGRPRGRSGSGEPRPHPRPSSVPSSPMTRHRAGQL